MGLVSKIFRRGHQSAGGGDARVSGGVGAGQGGPGVDGSPRSLIVAQILCTLAGLALIVAGVALVCVPAALVVAGAALAFVGLVVLDDGSGGGA